MQRLSSLLIITLMLSLIAVAVRPVVAQDDDLDLGATFESSDGALMFDYPSDWYAEEFVMPGVAFLSTSQSALYTALQTGAPAESSGLLFNIIGPQASRTMFEDAPPATLEDALAAFTATSNETEFGDPTALTVGDYDVLYVSASGPGGEGLGIALAINDGYALISASAATGEFTQYEDTVWAIIETIRYTVPEGMIRFNDDSIYFDYPADWHMVQAMQGSYIAFNDLSMSTTPEPGQIMIVIAIPESVAMRGMPDHADPPILAEEFTALWVEDEYEIGEPETITLGDADALRFTFASDTNEGYAIFVATDADTLAIFVSAASGELADFEAEVAAIIDSIVYKPGE